MAIFLGALLTSEPGFAIEVTVHAYAKKVDEYGDNIPHDHWPRGDQQTVVDPDELEHCHDYGHCRIHADA
jgi:hypothetical protein